MLVGQLKQNDNSGLDLFAAVPIHAPHRQVCAGELCSLIPPIGVSRCER